MSKHLAVYVRVSSKQQDLKSQKPDLLAWADAQRKPPVVFYTDKFTGKTMERPGWSKLMAAWERGEIATICVWRLDRLGRTAKGLTALFADLQAPRVAQGRDRLKHRHGTYDGERPRERSPVRDGGSGRAGFGWPSGCQG